MEKTIDFLQSLLHLFAQGNAATCTDDIMPGMWKLHSCSPTMRDQIPAIMVDHLNKFIQSNNLFGDIILHLDLEQVPVRQCIISQKLVSFHIDRPKYHLQIIFDKIVNVTIKPRFDQMIGALKVIGEIYLRYIRYNHFILQALECEKTISIGGITAHIENYYPTFAITIKFDINFSIPDAKYVEILHRSCRMQLLPKMSFGWPLRSKLLHNFY